MLTDAEARFVASGWADGGDIFQVFASTGATSQPEAGERHTYASFLEQIGTLAGIEALQFDGDAEAYALTDLKAYVEAVGERGPVDGWAAIPECDLERENRLMWEEQDRQYWQMRSDELREMRQY